MAQYISAKEFRTNFTELVEQIKKGLTLIVVKRSRPVFKVLPIDSRDELGESKDLLREVSINPERAPSLTKINSIIHALRKKKRKK